MGMWVRYRGTELTLQGSTARRNHRARPPYFTQIFIDLSDSKGPLVHGGDEEERRAGCREVKRRWKRHMLRSCQAGFSVNMSHRAEAEKASTCSSCLFVFLVLDLITSSLNHVCEEVFARRENNNNPGISSNNCTSSIKSNHNATFKLYYWSFIPDSLS